MRDSKKTIKIILSPSKTQQMQPIQFNVPQKMEMPRFYHESRGLLLRVKSYSKEELGKRLQIKGKILDETYHTYHSHDQQTTNHAIAMYTGLVYKGLQLETYTEKELAYIKSHVRILSAFYGLLLPFDGIETYRLDMKSKVFENGSYGYWEDRLQDCFDKEDVIVNLASDEFSKMIKHPMITIQFKTRGKNNDWVTKSTPAKMARGKMAHYMITQGIHAIEQLKNFEWNGYRYSEALSDKNNIVFIG